MKPVQPRPAMRIGLISDTHDFLDPRLATLFAGVEHILHAGDVGRNTILVQLERIAPVTAVLGNTDTGLALRETEVIELAAKRFLVHHIVNPEAPAEALQRRLLADRPDVVVFGHTHQAFARTIGGIFFVNPGYAGRPRFGQPRSVAVLECEDGRLHLTHVPL